tara:strand:- start:732 stop:1139 length:408 start_codon:yes stop_codon:yes gene_type:complete
MKATSITLILLVFAIGCQELPKQQEKINLETFLIGDMWCDVIPNYSFCLEYMNDRVILGIGDSDKLEDSDKGPLNYINFKIDNENNKIFQELIFPKGNISSEETWSLEIEVIYKDTISIRRQGETFKNKLTRIKL